MNLTEINASYDNGTLGLMNEETLFAAQNKVDITIERLQKENVPVSKEGIKRDKLEHISSFITAALNTKYDPQPLPEMS